MNKFQEHDLTVLHPVERKLAHDQTMSFGRSGCDLAIGTGDRGVSRISGLFECIHGDWILTNCSLVRPFHLIADTGLQYIVAPQERHILRDGGFNVQLAGTIQTYNIEVRVGEASTSHSDRPPSSVRPLPAEMTVSPTLTLRERQAVAALASPYLLPPPRYEFRPLTYSEAGQLIDIDAVVIRKRVERVRSKLTKVGVPGLLGPDSRGAICEFLLAAGIITTADLELVAGLSDRLEGSRSDH